MFVYWVKCIWYMESFVLPTVGCDPQEVIITERQLYGSESFFAWNFYASVSLHTVCLMYKINWCINQIKSSVLPTFAFAHKNSIRIWRNSLFFFFFKSLIGYVGSLSGRCCTQGHFIHLSPPLLTPNNNGSSVAGSESSSARVLWCQLSMEGSDTVFKIILQPCL